MSANSIANPTHLKKDERGSVTILFGLSVVALSLFVGLAFDVGRVYSTKSKITAAADAAALAAAKAIRLEGLSDAQATTLATTIFQENMISSSARWTDVRSLSVTVDRNTGRAIVSVDTAVKAHFAGLAGIPEFRVPAVAQALFEGGDIEISLQLDLTGSMCNAGPTPCTNHPKIQGLKDATKDLIDIVMPDNPGNERIRVAFAPFTAGVNLGAYQAAVTENRTTVNGCVYERLSLTNQASDNAPTGNDRYMVTGDLPVAPASNPRPCPAANIIPLTDRKQFLKDTVDTYVADGYTGGHNGTAWTWNMLSPNFASVWPADSAPAAYGDASTQKVAILMTDGEYNAKNGRYQPASANQISGIAVDTCNAMKAAGIRVYTVGFALGGNATATSTLSACASSPGDFYQAATPEELRSAFRNIANNIVRLRLTN